ncbi:MAG: helix-turn-helix domain-containing protein [Cyanobium sp.]
MPRSRSRSIAHGLHGPGLTPVLDTNDFVCWDAALATTLGHHRSVLLDARERFEAHFQIGQLGPYGVMHLHGRGRVRLLREQCGASVLWLPLRGLSEERINGRAWLAEPGSGLLFQPGDAMQGETSEEIEGLSIRIPEAIHSRLPLSVSPSLAAGPLAQRLLACARQLAAAAAQRSLGAEHAADQFSDALSAWCDWQSQPQPRERITARRRRETVVQARQWMADRLDQRFTVAELSRSLEVSTRQLQYSFLQELGCAPMAEAKRLRLQRLRGLLLDRAQDQQSIAELMVASGLIASGVTSADYRRWCGESPRRTRQRRG